MPKRYSKIHFIVGQKKMALSPLLYIVLFTSLILLVLQLFVSNKQLSHLLFAIFCGSVAMSAAKSISGDAIGAYQYLIGMGACATCNCYWLLSRSLFRGKKSIAIEHVLFAVVIALLIVIQQGYLFATTSKFVSTYSSNTPQHFLGELTVLLSSCVLVLSFWEGCRGFRMAKKKEKAQRILFLATFGGAVASSKLFAGLFVDNPQALQWAIGIITICVLISTQILIFWRFKKIKLESNIEALANNTKCFLDSAVSQTENPAIEQLLAAQVKSTIIEKLLFLQPNLKVADVARELNVPEYRISKALRHHLNARNFNQYVNELRIGHAQILLTDLDKKKWPVLVVGLESGFASVGPFTRAFKTMTGCTPNQYRQQQLSGS